MTEDFFPAKETDRNCLPCPLRQGAAGIVYRGHPGYIENTQYDIAHCTKCGIAFALGEATPPYLFVGYCAS
jgi:hypothetical protein